MVIPDEDMTEAETHIERDKERVKWPRLCAHLRVEGPGLEFLLLLWRWTTYIACLPTFLSPFYLSQCGESNGHESILKSIKCCLNKGMIVTIGKIRYQKTRQANRDLMLRTRGLRLAANRPEICFVWTTQCSLSLFLNRSPIFKVGWFHIKIQTWGFSSKIKNSGNSGILFSHARLL